MAERWEDTYFLSLKESADIKVHVHLTGEKVTLYSSDSNVVGVDFHDPSPWHLRTTWTCAPDPDKNYLHLSNTELWTQLCALKDKVDTGHGHLMTMNGHLVFVFGHDTDNDAGLMVAEKANINKVLLAFLKKIDNEVKDIKLTCTVDWDATQVTGKDSSTEITDKSKEQEESFVTRTQSEQELSEGTFSFTGMTGRSKADKSLVAGSIRAEAINQFEGKTLIVFNDKSTAGPYVTTWNFNFFSNNHFLEISPDSWRCLRKNLTESFICEILKAVRGSLILYFAHPTKDDAIDMIIKHKKVKHIIIQCLRELDIKDSSIQVELRELSESEVQTAQTSVEEVSSVLRGVDSQVCETGWIGHSSENRQQTYHTGSVVGGLDMRDASVDKKGVTEGRSGHIGYFRGKELYDVTEEDIVGLLREKNLAKHIPLFQEHRIDGDLFSQVTDGELIDFGIGESFERKNILKLKKCLPK